MTSAIVVMVQLLARALIMLCDPIDAGVINIGVQYVRIGCSFNCVLYVTMYCFDSFALGVGRPKVALFNSLMDALVAKLALSWLATVVLGMGYTGVYLGQALSALIPAVIGVLFFYWGKWK